MLIIFILRNSFGIIGTLMCKAHEVWSYDLPLRFLLHKKLTQETGLREEQCIYLVYKQYRHTIERFYSIKVNQNHHTSKHTVIFRLHTKCVNIILILTLLVVLIPNLYC